MDFIFTSHSPDDTVKLGITLGRILNSGCVVGLIGELGSGKTCLVKGIAHGINRTAENEVTSPTFTILQEYDGRVPFYHFDAYRLSGVEDLETVGFEDYISGEGIAVIEWADRIKEALPAECLFVYLEVTDKNNRLLAFKAHGKMFKEILVKMKNDLNLKTDREAVRE